MSEDPRIQTGRIDYPDTMELQSRGVLVPQLGLRSPLRDALTFVFSRLRENRGFVFGSVGEEIAKIAPYANTDERGNYTGDLFPERDDDE